MIERPGDRDIEATLETWMDGVAPDRAPGRLLEETFARTMRTRQARTYPWHHLPRQATRWTWAGSKTLVLVIIALLVFGALGVGLGAGRGWFAVPATPSPSPTVSPRPASPSPAYAVIASPFVPSAKSVTPEAAIAVSKPVGMASDGQALWVLTDDGNLARIDPATNEVSDTLSLDGAGSIFNGVSAGSNGVWVTRWSPGLVYRIDPTTRKISATIDTDYPKGMLDASDAVWIANTHSGTVSRIDPATNTIAATITVGPAGNSGPNWLASGLGSIWVDIPNALQVVRIDPVTNLVQARITVTGNPTPCGGIAVAETAVWISSCDTSHWLTRVDPSTNTVAAILDMGGLGFAPMYVNGDPWISVDRGVEPASIFRIDPATNEFDRVLSPGDGFRGGGDMAIADGSVWIIDGANDRILRLPLAAFTPG